MMKIIHIGRPLVAAMALLLAAFSSAAALGQAAPPAEPQPQEELVTPEGVNLVDRTFQFMTKGVSVGQGDFPAKLTYRRKLSTYTPQILDTSIMTYLFFGTVPEGQYEQDVIFVSYQGKQHIFLASDLSSMSYDGSTLTFEPTGGNSTYLHSDIATVQAPNGVYTFHLKDGTEAKIISSLDYYCNYLAWCAQSVQAPNGTFADYEYTSLAPYEGVTIHKVANSLGYSLNFNFDSQNNLTVSGSATCTAGSAVNCNIGTFEQESYVATNTSFTEIDYLNGPPTTTQIPVIALVVNSQNRTTTFGYANGAISSIRYPENPNTDAAEITYSTDLRCPSIVTSYKDGAGNVTHFQNSVTTDLNGNTVDNTCLPGGTTITDPLQHQSKYSFGVNNVLVSYQDPLGNVRTYTYENDPPEWSPRLIGITEPSGLQAQYGYDDRGNVTVKLQHGAGQTDRTLTATYPTCDATNYRICNKPSYVVDERGYRTDFQYDPAHGGLTVLLAPADANGTRAVTRYNYDSFYPAPGVPIPSTMTAPSAYLKTSEDTCRSSTVTGTTVDFSFVCPIADRVRTAYTIAPSTSSAPAIAALQSVVADAGGINRTTSYVWDQVGNKLSEDGPQSGAADTTFFAYDVDGHLTGTIAPDPDGAGPIAFAAVRNSYDANGRPTRVEKGELATLPAPGADPASWSNFTVFQTVDTSFDLADRKTLDTLSSGGTSYTATQYSYDDAGRPECIAQRMNPAAYNALPASACALGTAGSAGPDRITRNVYDAAGHVLKLQKAVGTPLQQGYATYTYNADGKPLSMTDANGNMASMSYDGFDRLVQWNFPDKTTPGAVSASDYEAYGYDAGDNRVSLRKRDGRTIGYSYDALNRVTAKLVNGSCVPGYACTAPLAGAVRNVYYGYDLRGLQLYARFDSASGEGITNSYDALGELSGTTSTMGGVARTLAYQYDAAGNRTRLTHPDGTHFDATFDALDRVVLAQWTTPSAQTYPFLNIPYVAQGQRDVIRFLNSTSKTRYTYDNISRLVLKKSSRVDSEVTSTFTYNPANQIVQQVRDNDSNAFTNYVSANNTYAANGLNQYTAVGVGALGYDANGNLTSTGGTTLVYDVENRLVQATGTLTLNLAYDPLGRLWQTSGGAYGTSQFLYDGDEAVLEYDGVSGAIRRRFAFGPDGDEPMLWDEGSAMDCSATKALHADNQGSIIAAVDCNGNTQAINTYDEYGVPGSGNVGRYQYTGQMYLPELGMYYYKARIYASRLGRFLQTDPIGYGDQNNLYSYVGNDPVNGTDPSGTRQCAIGDTTCTPDPETEDDGKDVVVTARRQPKITDNLPIRNPLANASAGQGSVAPGTGAGPQKEPLFVSRCGSVPEAPPGVTLGANANLALYKRNNVSPFRNFADMIPMFRTGGSMDFKIGNKYVDFGNFNYGAYSILVGFDASQTRANAEAYSLYSRHAFDQPEDRAMIAKGIKMGQCILAQGGQ